MTPAMRQRIRYARSVGYHVFQRDATDEFIVKRTWDSVGQHVKGLVALGWYLPDLPTYRSPYPPEEFSRREQVIKAAL